MPAQDLMVTTDSHDSAAVIHVVGELDLSTVAVFDAELQLALTEKRIVVVLSECTFIDSSALQSLVRAQRVIRDSGEVCVVAPSEPARRVLEVAALDRVIPVFETVAEALTSTA